MTIPTWFTDDWNPLDAVFRNLEAEANGTTVNTDEAQLASEILALQELVAGGYPLEKAIERMDDPHTVHISWENGKLEISIDWDEDVA